MKEVVIVSGVRTPIGSFLGNLSSVSAPNLMATAISEAVKRANVAKEEIDEAFIGNVLTAGIGQAPAKQAVIAAGLGSNIPCTTVNKVCSSGMKSVFLGAQSIMTGDNSVVIAGGMENMSQVPSYLMSNRIGKKLGNETLLDGLVHDGLTNVYDQQHMGNCAESCATEFHITREEQDEYALASYSRAAAAWNEGKMKDEVVPVSVPQRKGNPVVVDQDEEFKNVSVEKVPTLRPVFQKEGTVTAANASTLNDGASALILMDAEKAKSMGLKPMAKIIGYTDASIEPEKFTNAPAKAIEKLLEKTNMTTKDVDYWEINEAFSVVSLANMKMLDLDPSKVNIYGGAVSLGHPLGNSGSRILVTLLNVLNQNNAKLGCAAICNGGGGASAILIERIA